MSENFGQSDWNCFNFSILLLTASFLATFGKTEPITGERKEHTADR